MAKAKSRERLTSLSLYMGICTSTMGKSAAASTSSRPPAPDPGTGMGMGSHRYLSSRRRQRHSIAATRLARPMYAASATSIADAARHAHTAARSAHAAAVSAATAQASAIWNWMGVPCLERTERKSQAEGCACGRVQQLSSACAFLKGIGGTGGSCGLWWAATPSHPGPGRGGASTFWIGRMWGKLPGRTRARCLVGGSEWSSDWSGQLQREQATEALFRACLVLKNF